MKLALVGALVLCCVLLAEAASSSAKTNTTVTTKGTPTSRSGGPKSTAASTVANAGGQSSSKSRSSTAPAKQTTTTPKPITCYKLTCKKDGCLKNITKPQSAATCTGAFCKIESTIAANVTTITASCASACKKSTTVYCCTTDKCNNDDALIKSQFNGADRVSMKYAGLILAQFLLFWVISS